MLLIALGSILCSLLADELFAWLPWLTSMVVRLAARIDADHPDEIDDIHAEHMDGIDALPGRLVKLIAAGGLLFKVAIARRIYDAALAIWCGVWIRIGLARTAIARQQSPPTPASAVTATIRAEKSLVGPRPLRVPIVPSPANPD